MDRTPIRLVALVGPLAVVAVLAVAAGYERPGPAAGPPGDLAPRPGLATAVGPPSTLGLPHTTPPPVPVEQARTGAAPLPEPARTAGAG